MNLPLWQSLWALPLHTLDAWCGFMKAQLGWWQHRLDHQSSQRMPR